MSRTSKVSLKLLQGLFVVGLLAGCATEPENKPMMMGADGKPMCGMCMDKMNGGDMSCCNECCQDMKMDMKNMSPKQKKMMKQCMKMHKDMMGNKNMSMPSDQSSPQSTQTDNDSHAQHHPAGSN